MGIWVCLKRMDLENPIKLMAFPGRISRLRGHFTDTPMYSMNIEYCFDKMTTVQVFPNFNPSFKLLQHGEVDK